MCSSDLVRMHALINDLLAFSRVTSQGVVPRRTSADEALSLALHDLGPALTEACATVRRAPLPDVEADPGQLRQVFQNLVGNAVKFRRDGVPPVVELGAERSGGAVTFSVRDNGVGIEAEYFGRIFELFQRLHGRDAYPGTGLGLAIVRKIVERHGGRIWLASSPGEGTTFFFTLPEGDP